MLVRFVSAEPQWELPYSQKLKSRKIPLAGDREVREIGRTEGTSFAGGGNGEPSRPVVLGSRGQEPGYLGLTTESPELRCRSDHGCSFSPESPDK